jgi:hypothetical protein
LRSGISDNNTGFMNWVMESVYSFEGQTHIMGRREYVGKPVGRREGEDCTGISKDLIFLLKNLN